MSKGLIMINIIIQFETSVVIHGYDGLIIRENWKITMKKMKNRDEIYFADEER